MINSAQQSPLLQEIAREDFLLSTSNQKKSEDFEMSVQSDFKMTSQESEGSALKNRRNDKLVRKMYEEKMLGYDPICK